MRPTQMEIKGQVYQVGQAQQVTDKFKKREVILVTREPIQSVADKHDVSSWSLSVRITKGLKA